jgi:hypothetical protein
VCCCVYAAIETVRAPMMTSIFATLDCLNDDSNITKIAEAHAHVSLTAHITLSVHNDSDALK